jgi:hypothetical protein
MSKQLKVQESNKQIFSIMEAQLQRQDEQGKTIRSMFDGMKSMYSDFSGKFEIMTEMVQEVRDSVTLNNAECTMMQIAVATKSISLTKDRYTEEDEPFKNVVGKHRRMIWKQLKEKFGIPKYNCIRRIDYDNSIAFVNSFKPEDYI